ncbi:MAG: cytidylate kinase family protein [Candidatus Methylomirabilia bacterium]
MAIICISHEMGAGGPEIGMAVAQRLGYRYVDQELISEAARRYGLLEEKLAQLDETKPSLFERFDAETRRYITAIQTALYEFAEGDNVVLMGRGGQWLLRGIAHVLRLRVIAPVELRIDRLVKKMSEQVGQGVHPRTVTEMVRRDDAERSARMRYLFEVDLASPALYDLVINTVQLSFEAVVEMISSMVGRPEFVSRETGKQAVADRALASKVHVALAANSQTRRYRISVEARQGVVTLEGTSVLDAAVEVARGVQGVEDVKAQQVEVPPIPPFVA